MPTKKTKTRARAAKRQGKKPTTQAGEFVKEEMKKYERGSGNVRSRKQAIAIGLSEARRAGVKLKKPAKGKASPATRKKAARDSAIGSGRAKPSPSRSRGAKKSRSHPRPALRAQNQLALHPFSVRTPDVRSSAIRTQTTRPHAQSLLLRATSAPSPLPKTGNSR
jgi:hypothetical protein